VTSPAGVAAAISEIICLTCDKIICLTCDPYLLGISRQAEARGRTKPRSKLNRSVDLGLWRAVAAPGEVPLRAIAFDRNLGRMGGQTACHKAACITKLCFPKSLYRGYCKPNGAGEYLAGAEPGSQKYMLTGLLAAVDSRFVTCASMPRRVQGRDKSGPGWTAGAVALADS
jgi:hypothetical protein